MLRWVIITGLATILISLVALVSLSGNSSQPTTEEALQEPDTLEAPETPEPAPEPAPEPSTEPTTTPEQDAESNPSTEDTEGGLPVQGIRPSDRQAAGPGPRVATIEIAGDSHYSCSLGRLNSPRTVRGRNPASFQVRVTRGGTSLDTVMATCQKISGEELGVGIIYDEEVKAQGDTTERFGTVSVSWSPMQE